MNMERYDGKTKRDDYIKYGLITLAVVVVLGGLIWLTHFMKGLRQTNPDYTIVIGSEEAFSESMLTDLEFAFREVIGDRNGDDKVVVDIEVLRLTDYGQAVLDDAQAQEDYANAVLAGDSTAENEAKFSGLSGDDDFSRMLLLMNTGECDLFLLSDQPRGGFRGAATTYCEQGYFVDLPSDLADETYGNRCDISSAPFWAQIGIEDVPFYACVLDRGDGEAMEDAIEIIRKLKDAYVTLW